MKLSNSKIKILFKIFFSNEISKYLLYVYEKLLMHRIYADKKLSYFRHESRSADVYRKHT